MSEKSITSLKYRLRYILPYYRQNVRAFLLGFLLLVATSASAAAIPYLMKLATEALTMTNTEHNLSQYVIALMLMALLHAFFRIRSRTHIFAIGRQVEYALRREYHAKLLSLDTQFFMAQKTGDLVSRGNNDILAVRMFIGPGFLQIANAVMAYAITLPVMMSLDPYLTLLTLTPFPLILGSSRLLTKRLYRLSKIVADKFGHFSAFVQEAVAGAAVIRSHAREEDWNRRFADQTQNVYHAQMQHMRLQSLFGPIIVLAGGLSGWIILFVGGKEVVAGHLTIGDFVAFFGYLALLVMPTVGFGWILTVLQRGLAALERIGVILDTQSFVLLPPPPLLSTSPLRGRLSLQNLYFPTTEPFLKNIQMEIPAGSFIGLAGRIGSGKTMLLNCLSRLYPVAPGSIFVDGHDIMSLPETVLRNTLSMAQQESFLFSTTIRNNLLLGRLDAEDQKVWMAARLAAFAPEIERFPNQLDTLVGERGITLSGGQRQRLSLARAVLTEPAILLLDDIFSSVDARTEAEILDNIHALVGTRTIIMVCHRTTALHRADQVYLLDQGQIVSHGNHKDLLETSTLYQSLHQQMARAEALESLL